MSNNDWKKRLGVVFSTNSDFEYGSEEENTNESIPPEQQTVYISLDRKQRKGKSATLIEGFIGTDNDLQELAQTLKKKCGVGGSTKDRTIIIQGDKRDMIENHLKKKGYKTKRKGG
ncbi:MAG: translation initiation factor [Bacteroidales bacterium]|jgi:translation initiation factor 1|nr:translation initiation factor [Bacteroidales bacterium]